MPETYDLLIRGGTLVTHAGVLLADVGIRDGRIAGVGRISPAAAGEVFDALGLHVLPGVMDPQVHFREPGGEHKEDLASGTAAAALGGVTAVFEMPNTSPPTTSAAALEDKLARARGRAWVDHAFYVGATEENVDRLPVLERLPGCAGVKVFMGSSTGNLLVATDAGVEAVLRSVGRRAAFHCEDEERLRERMDLRVPGDPSSHPVWRDVECALRATRRLLAIARRLGKRVHVLHVTTREEMALLADHKDIATVEVPPQHLTLAAPECYERLGAYAQMNPPIRDAEHREGLWKALREGVVDVLGSDHAPHTREEKEAGYPRTPSGMPGVQTLLPVMLDHVHRGRLSLEHLVDLTSAGVARVFGVARKGRLAVGYDADLTLVDLDASRVIEDSWIASKAGWTPFAGMQVTGWPVATIVRGRIVMRDDELLGSPEGRPVRFLEALSPDPE